MRNFVPLLLMVLGACAHSPPTPVSEEIRIRRYAGDLVSVQSALELAHASYVLGCVEARRAAGLEAGHRGCMKGADEHVRGNVLFVMDQDGTGTKPRAP